MYDRSKPSAALSIYDQGYTHTYLLVFPADYLRDRLCAQSSLLFDRPRDCSSSSMPLACGRVATKIFMHDPQVPFPGARLSELMAAKFALKWLQVDVSQVVSDQTCALCESFAAEGTGGVNEHASEMRCAVTRALDRDLDFLEGAAREDFEACVERPARNGSRSRLHSGSSSALLATNLDSLVHSTTFRLCHCLHARRAVALCDDLDSLEAAQVFTFFLLLLLNVECSRL